MMGVIKLKIDAVFEGGGVKGIGFTGAVAEIEKAGYSFENIAGTSAGAIIATLVAVGYTSQEIKDELEILNYNYFKDESALSKLGITGKLISIVLKYGIYKGDFFEEWMEDLLERKGISTFGQLITDNPQEKYKYKLQIIATDITNRRLLILPRDLKYFGFDPDEFSIARAVRMSMSIPLFFKPVKIIDTNGKEHIIVDGGLLSNYPIWLLDDNTSNPPWPTFGFKLMEPNKRKLEKGKGGYIKNPISFFQALISTMLEAHDKLHISESKGDYDRTIGIPTTININGREKEIKTTDFNITREEGLLLYENGEEVAKKFLENWNFEKWKEDYRK